jgi:hypothetical protein
MDFLEGTKVNDIPEGQMKGLKVAGKQIIFMDGRVKDYGE